jgi:hypothetical protein
MDLRYLVRALAIYAVAGAVQARAQDSLIGYKSLARPKLLWTLPVRR